MIRTIAAFLIVSAAASTSPAQAGQRAQAPASNPSQNGAPAGDHDRSSPGIKNLFWQPNDLQQGSVAFFTVELERVPARVTGRWIGKDLKFFKSGNPKIWYALAGADLETQPGSYDVNLTATSGGKVLRAVKSVAIAAANFKSADVAVAQNFVEPDAAEKKQIGLDQLLKDRAFARVTPLPLWSGNFINPVQAKPTDTFGESRLFNEELSSTHRGTDFPVAEGTPVVASNSGTVVLAKELFYEGNCVIVDHGDRFFTTYMHLSKMLVKGGEKLKKGERIGLAGKTGRVTGPHLHMGVRWNGAYVDPTKLLALTLPELKGHEKPASLAVKSRRHRSRR